MKPAPATWSAVPGAAPPGLPEPRFSLVIIGDVRLEFRARLPDRRFTEITDDHLSYTAAQVLVSGTAVNLARHSVGHFRTVTVAGKIGDDAFTPVIRSGVRGLGAHDLLTVHPGVPNGCTMMLRDHPADGGHGARLLVVGETAPSRLLSEQDVRRYAPAIREADALFVDGYSLLSEISRRALLAAARVARSAGTLVAFDLVPHDIHARLERAEILPVLDAADVVISGAATLAPLVGLPPARTTADVRCLLPLLDDVSGGERLWLLRFGETGMERVIGYRLGEVLLDYPTGYGTDGEYAGYGDRLAVSELRWWLSRTAGR